MPINLCSRKKAAPGAERPRRLHGYASAAGAALFLAVLLSSAARPQSSGYDPRLLLVDPSRDSKPDKAELGNDRFPLSPKADTLSRTFIRYAPSTARWRTAVMSEGLRDSTSYHYRLIVEDLLREARAAQRDGNHVKSLDWSLMFFSISPPTPKPRA